LQCYLPQIAASAIIGLVGNLRSTLARNADAVLDAGVDKEACPFNLAPTTSTTVALSIGDALAMTLMQVKVNSRILRSTIQQEDWASA